ncbi:hypothetical protein PENTCL1PPCAC_23418, partial [Pristionchus entomophagus]
SVEELLGRSSLPASAMANNQKRILTPEQSFNTIKSMISDLSLFTSNTCNGSFEDDDLDKPRRATDYRSLQRVVSDVETSMGADRAYNNLMDSDFERSFILVPNSVLTTAPQTLKTVADQAPIDTKGKKLNYRDDESAISTRTSAMERSDSESDTRTPQVKEQRKKERKNEKRSDSNRPSAAPSYMTVIGDKTWNNDVEVSKASTNIDSGFDAKISVKRKEQELCKLDLSADVANGNVRSLKINRQTFR